MINKQYIDFHPTDERNVVICRLIPDESVIKELRNQVVSDVTILPPQSIRRSELGHVIELNGCNFHVDCPIQEEQELRVLERQGQPRGDLYMGRQFRVGSVVEGRLEVAAENFKDKKSIRIDLEEITREAGYRWDHREDYPEVFEEFDEILEGGE